MGRRIRGFSLKHRAATLFRRAESSRVRVKPFCRLIGWAHNLRKKAKAMLAKSREPGRDHIRVGSERVFGRPEPVPKGQMAVYVGQKDGEFRRILVPVVYFNHPLFGELLRESEDEFGFDQPGGLTIPCRVSEFERVQTRIKTGRSTRKLLRWN